MAGTREDAMLMVEIAKWGAMIDLGEASRVVFADGFKPESFDARDQPIQTILIYYETVGTLVKNDLLDRDLVLDWLWVSGAWERVGPIALRAREQAGVPALFENFEALAASQAG
jgi:hypothetical protein